MIQVGAGVEIVLWAQVVTNTTRYQKYRLICSVEPLLLTFICLHL